MTMAPKMKKSAATAISALFRLNAGLPSPPCVMEGPSASGEEAGGLHELPVALLFLGHPVGVLLADEGGLVEGALFHELLPLGRGHDLLEEVHVVLHLVGLDPGRGEDAAQHEVLDVEAGL